jgi:flagellar biosynthesis protein FlhF
MQLKRYRGREVPEVMRQVRGDLGEDAVILHTRQARPWGPLRFLGGTRVEVVAAAPSGAPTATATPPVGSTGQAAAVTSMPTQEAAVTPTASRGPAPRDAASSSDAVLALAAEVAELRALLIHFGAARLLHPSVAPYQHRLIAAGVDGSVAFGLVRSLPEPTPEMTPTPEILRAALENNIAGALRVSTEKLPEAGVLAFVGPHGSGKTLALAKLAGQAALAGRRTSVITTDGERLGATAQLDAFCAIAGVGCGLALTPEALARGLEARGPDDLVLIDTPGLGVRDATGLRRLRDTLAAARPTSVHLVLSAAAKAADGLAAARAFGDVGVTDLLFTRLDETVTPGSLITIAAGAALPLSFVGTGTEVPADIEPASARDIARRVLGGDPRP